MPGSWRRSPGAAVASWRWSPGAGTAAAENPCEGPSSRHLLCPNLRIGPPPTSTSSAPAGGRVRLRATSDVRSRGRGPMELRGRRDGRHSMRVRQRDLQSRRRRTSSSRTEATPPLHRRRRLLRRQLLEGARARAASSSGRSTGGTGRRRRVRTGPKLNYCLRDLERTAPRPALAPQPRTTPAATRTPTATAVTLGTSVGWSDIYPADYDKQWINVAGLRGCFAFVMRVDPQNLLYESHEDNNSLPPPGPPPLPRPRAAEKSFRCSFALYTGQGTAER